MSRKQRRGPGGEAGDDGPWLDAGAARPGLLLFVAGVDAALEPALTTGAIAGLVAERSAVAGWRELCRRHETALLALDDLSTDQIDGVHLTDPARLAEARVRLGPERLVGADCGRSRHAAMVAGEAGADYVMFGDLDRPCQPGDELFELARWWSELFVIPNAAAGPLEPALACQLIDAGADLLAMRVAGGQDERIAAIAGAILNHKRDRPERAKG